MAKTARSRSQARKPSRRAAGRRPRASARRTAKPRSRVTRKRAARPKRRTRTLRAPARSRTSRRTAGQALASRADAAAPLDFAAGDERYGRVGDARPINQQRDEFPAQRVREAGTTAGETPTPERNTADDAAPDTLLDDEGGRTPADQRGPRAADTALSTVDEAAIGAGGGTDEAEDARRRPISRAEHRRLKARVARAARSINDVEPYEASAGSPGRERNRPA